MHCECKQANCTGRQWCENGYTIYSSLTPAPSWANIPLPLQNQWLGFGDLELNGAAKGAYDSAFFMPVMAGCVGIPSGMPVSVYPGSPTLRSPPPSEWRQWWRIPFLP